MKKTGSGLAISAAAILIAILLSLASHSTMAESIAGDGANIRPDESANTEISAVGDLDLNNPVAKEEATNASDLTSASELPQDQPTDLPALPIPETKPASSSKTPRPHTIDASRLIEIMRKLNEPYVKMMQRFDDAKTESAQQAIVEEVVADMKSADNESGSKRDWLNVLGNIGQETKSKRIQTLCLNAIMDDVMRRREFAPQAIATRGTSPYSSYLGIDIGAVRRIAARSTSPEVKAAASRRFKEVLANTSNPESRKAIERAINFVNPAEAIRRAKELIAELDDSPITDNSPAYPAAEGSEATIAFRLGKIGFQANWDAIESYCERHHINIIDASARRGLFHIYIRMEISGSRDAMMGLYRLLRV